MSDLAEIKQDLHALKGGFEDHSREDREDFSIINTKLSVIKDNHLAHMQADMSSMASDMKEMKNGMNGLKADVDANSKDTAEAKTNIGWLMKIGGAVGGTLLVAMVGLIFAMLQKGAGL